MIKNDYFLRGQNLSKILNQRVVATMGIECDNNHEPIENFIKKTYFNMRLYYFVKWKDEELHHQK